MKPLLIAATRELLRGSPAYEPRSPWPPVLAVVAAIAILGAGAMVAMVVVGSLDFVSLRVRLARSLTTSHDGEAGWVMAVWLLAMQATVIALVAAASGLFGGRPAEVLSLDRKAPGRFFAAAIVLMFLLQLGFNAVVLPFAHDTVMEDVKPFLDPLRSDAAPLFVLAIVAGAPVSEELLFRGFLLSALARTRIGFFGAALVTTLGWTALHAGYSGLGLIEVFLAGLFFSWLLWRTGNLWVSMICHAVYNGTVLAALLALAPD